MTFQIYLNVFGKLPSTDVAAVTSKWKIKFECSLVLKLNTLKQEAVVHNLFKV